MIAGRKSCGVLGLLALPVITGCGDDPAPRATLEIDSTGGTLTLMAPLALISPDTVLQPDHVISDLVFPTDLSTLADGRIVVLDRLERAVIVMSSQGRELHRFGREGDGPGEFEAPYAIAASSGDRIAVLDINRTLTEFYADGVLSHMIADVGGDGRSPYQRSPNSQWEEPFQLSREDVTRRLGPHPLGGFAIQLQEVDERTDSIFWQASAPLRYPHRLGHFQDGSEPSWEPVGMGSELRPYTQDMKAGQFRMPQERSFALRPIWASGKDWLAIGHGKDTTVRVIRFSSTDVDFRRVADRADSPSEAGSGVDGGTRLSGEIGFDTLVVSWSRNNAPLDDKDFHAYIGWEIEAYRRLEGDDVADQVAEIPRENWISEELSLWTERPQVAGLLGAGPCLALLPFDYQDGPLGEGSTISLLNLAASERSMAIRLESPNPGFTRHLSQTHVYRIAFTEDGRRLIERYSLPHEACAS